MKKLDNNIIINDFIKIHGNKYDYSLVKYIGNLIKVKIICPKHGIFEQMPKNHKRGQGCPRCSNVNNKEDFIKKSIIIHNDKYDYSLVDYMNSKTKVKIICNIHGIFEQNPNDHLSGYGCTKCGINKRTKINTLDKKEFIRKSIKIHKNDYNYSMVDYKKSTEKVKIICLQHGIFEQTPHSHLKGSGCPKCKKISKGEKKILYFLESNNIKYKFQKKFNNCKNQNYLIFDFYLPEYNICLEYDGEQHFKPIKYWGGEKGYLERIENDKIKNDFCKNNNIKLIRIRYDENVEEILELVFI